MIPSRERRFLVGLTGLLGGILVGLYLVTHFLVAPWTVEGRSMAPTLEPGDRVLVDLRSYARQAPGQGDVVLLERAGSKEMLVKRVDRRAGGRFWVRGDNPAASEDSRSFGPVRREAIRGKVVFRYWPPSGLGPIR